MNAPLIRITAFSGEDKESTAGIYHYWGIE